MGFRSVENPKTSQILIRVTPDEKADIQAKADACYLPISQFMLKCAQGRQTRSKFEMHLINELMLIARQLKEIYHAEKPRVASELEPVLAAVVRAIDRIGTESRIRL